MQWYFKIGDQQLGPMESHDLKRLAADGELCPEDLVRRKGDKAWAKAARVRGLFPHHESPLMDVGVGEAEYEEPSAVVARMSARSDSDRDRSCGTVASNPVSASPRVRISLRDALGVGALVVSGMMLIATVWFYFRGLSGERGFEHDTVATARGDIVVSPGRPLIDTDAVADSSDAVERSGSQISASEGGVYAAEDQVDALRPAVPVGEEEAVVEGRDQPFPEPEPDSHGLADPLRPVVGHAVEARVQAGERSSWEPPASDAGLRSGVRDEPDWPVQSTDFQVVQDESRESADPFGPSSGTPPATPEPADDAAALAEQAAPPDPRDDAHREKLEQLFEQTRSLLAEWRLAQDTRIALQKEIQETQARINEANITIARHTQDLWDVQGKLGVRGLLPQQRRILQQQAVSLSHNLTQVQNAKSSFERRLRMELPHKLQQAERAAAAAWQKTDATIPAWIELADLFAEQSRVAHQRMVEGCAEWVTGESPFIPATFMRGFAAWHVRDADLAMQDFNHVVQLAQQRDPKTASPNQQELLALALAARSVLHAERKQETEARADYARAAEILPRSSLMYVFRGRSNALLGRTRAALDDFRRATQLDSKHPAAYRKAAWLLASSPGMQEGRRAVDLSRIACELTDWNQWQCLDAFALANAADGNFELAMEKAREARDLAPRNVRSEIENRLELYQAGVVPQNVIHR